MSARWLPEALLRTAAAMRVFCLPHAGAGASTYRLWGRELPPELQVCPVQLPGRENRLGEPPIDDARALTRALADGLRPFLDRSYVLFGHSMGALLAYELTCEFRRQAVPLPVHLFLSAHRAPHLPGGLPHVHLFDRAAFREELRHIDGTPAAVLEQEELMDIAEPILRADFRLCETYTWEPVEPLDVPMSIFGGEEDPKVAPRVLEPWQQHTTHPMRLRLFPGGHLFIQQRRADVVSALLEDLRIETVRLTL